MIEVGLVILAIVIGLIRVIVVRKDDHERTSDNP